MNPNPSLRSRGVGRRHAALALLGTALTGCGGGSSVGGGAGPVQATRDFRTLSSRYTSSSYALDIHLPPASAGPRAAMPVVYVLDGESWFDSVKAVVESLQRSVIVVGIQSGGQRSRDFVPANSCTSDGGGQAAYFEFIRQELIPAIEASYGGDPAQRVIFGHSHGGSFVLYAMFAEAPGQHRFSTYLACDASLGCMAAAASGWEHAYAAAHRELPVRLHLSSASLGNHVSNVEYADLIAQRRYAHLTFTARVYNGTHGGIVPQVLADGLGSAFAGSP
jgi:predicted alpha/beta superfamily hydrolase